MGFSIYNDTHGTDVGLVITSLIFHPVMGVITTTVLGAQQLVPSITESEVLAARTTFWVLLTIFVLYIGGALFCICNVQGSYQVLAIIHLILGTCVSGIFILMCLNEAPVKFWEQSALEVADENRARADGRKVGLLRAAADQSSLRLNQPRAWNCNICGRVTSNGMECWNCAGAASAAANAAFC